MKYYKVEKVDSITGKTTNYGINCEEDMKLITRGYKQDELLTNMYNREKSRYFFLVDEVPNY